MMCSGSALRGKHVIVVSMIRVRRWRFGDLVRHDVKDVGEGSRDLTGSGQ